jgi:SAM-dependent methyltransferase
MAETEYVLGTHDEEIARLGVQHRAWLTHATAAWRRARFRAGQTVIDLGSGPGYATIDLARIVGRGGRVIALERSSRFLSHLKAECARLGLAQVEPVEADLDESLPVSTRADALWCRWVCAFVRHPRELIAGIRRVMNDDASVVFHEYGEYRSWRLLPACPELDEFVDLVIASWRADGGEPDVGRSIPGWLEESGFVVESVKPIVEVITPADYMWQWPKAFVEVGTERLRTLGAIDAARALRIREAFAQAEATPGARMVTPLVLETIARAR